MEKMEEESKQKGCAAVGALLCMTICSVLFFLSRSESKIQDAETGKNILIKMGLFVLIFIICTIAENPKRENSSIIKNVLKIIISIIIVSFILIMITTSPVVNYILYHVFVVLLIIGLGFWVYKFLKRQLH